MSSNLSDSGRGPRGGHEPVGVSQELPHELALAIDAIRPRLGRLGWPMLYFPVTRSTNDIALTLALHTEREGAVVIADAQTAGRGRWGREWFSPPAHGLYVSVVLTPGRASRGNGARATRLATLAAGLAIAEAITTTTGLEVSVKWPNDIHAAGRKVAGILAEASGGRPGDPLVLGYGINVGAAKYPPELRDRATSLETELGRAVDRAQLFAESLACLSRRYDDLLDGRFDAILDAWRARAPTCAGARVNWATPMGLMSGVTAGIDRDGALLVLAGDRVERIVAGEVTWL